MEVKFNSLKSNKADRLDQYLEVIDLPSKFRLYSTNKVYVRGLYFSEVEALSKFYDEEVELEKQLSKLITIFDDVIKGIDIQDLELPDFLILVAIANMLSFENYSPPIVFKCRNMIKGNPEKDKIKKQIERLEEEMASLDKEEEINAVMEEILKLTAKMETLPDESICNTPLTKPISIEEIEFYDVNRDIKDYIVIGSDKVELKPVTIKDIIQSEDFKRFNTDFNEKILKLAMYLDNQFPIGIRYKWVSTLPVREIEKIIEYDSKVDIKLKPIIRKCPKCGYPNKIYISLNIFKVLP